MPEPTIRRSAVARPGRSRAEQRQRKPLFRRAAEQLRRVVGERAFLLMSAYPPYLGANVRVRRVSPGATRFDVQMRLRPWNQNYFGTHFGGSLYSMCDPFYALILTENLGRGYVVGDKAGSIRFLRPGRGLVRACFEISGDRIEQIRQELDTQARLDVELATDILDEHNRKVARVEKVLSVQRRARS